MDFITIAQDLEIEQRRSYLKFYTEFHATQVALQTALGFERYNDNKQITLSDKLHVDNNAVNISNAQLLDVGEYMQRLTQKLSADIPQWFDKYEQEKSEPLALKTLFSSLLNQSVYYFAKIDFMDKYCVEDTSSLFDINLFVDSLGAEILQVYAVLNSGSIDKSKLDHIEALSQVILNNFFERMTGHKVPKT